MIWSPCNNHGSGDADDLVNVWQSTRSLSTWAFKKSSIKSARSNATLMFLKPSETFVNNPRVPLEAFDFGRVPALAQGMSSERIFLERRICAPTCTLRAIDTTSVHFKRRNGYVEHDNEVN